MDCRSVQLLPSAASPGSTYQAGLPEESRDCSLKSVGMLRASIGAVETDRMTNGLERTKPANAGLPLVEVALLKQKLVDDGASAGQSDTSPLVAYIREILWLSSGWLQPSCCADVTARERRNSIRE